MSKDILRVKDWKEKEHVQFIPQYCPETFVKQAKRILDGKIFRTCDVVIGPGKDESPVKNGQIIVGFEDDCKHVIIGSLFELSTLLVPINNISLISRPTDKEVVNYINYIKG